MSSNQLSNFFTSCSYFVYIVNIEYGIAFEHRENLFEGIELFFSIKHRRQFNVRIFIEKMMEKRNLRLTLSTLRNSFSGDHLNLFKCMSNKVMENKYIVKRYDSSVTFC